MKEKQKYIITIDEPCHENWEKMESITGGKFCQSCAKSVIDFTKLSDTQIIRIIENANGKNLCGKFNSDQLNKIIVQTNAKQHNPVLYKMLAALLLLASAETAVAQTTPVKQPTESLRSHVVGKIAPCPIISGKIIDENGNPVPGATIARRMTAEKIQADANGNFRMAARVGEELKISKKGFGEITAKVISETLTILINRKEATRIRENDSIRQSKQIYGGLGVTKLPNNLK